MVSVYTGLTLAVVTLLRLQGLGRVLSFAVVWTVFEWLRGHLFTGFPWNIAASVWSDLPVFLQSASVLGAWGMTLLTVLVASLPAAWNARHGRAAIAGGAALVVLGWGFGHWRLSTAEEAVVPGVRLRLVQASVPQSLKWEPEQRIAILRRHLAMTREPAAALPTLVVWPETAVPFVVEWEPEVVAAIADAAPAGGMVVTGTIRMRQGERPRRDVSNGLVAIDKSGQVVGTYDKVHLVPFGEYVPFRSLLGWLPLLPGESDMVPGPGLQELALPGLPPATPPERLPIRDLVDAYTRSGAEAMGRAKEFFPGQVLPEGRRPLWLLNLTNDAWYGRSAGPYQHFAAARMRTVEEGLPLVRAAQNGISAVVDPYGRVTARLGLDEIGVLDADLPAALPPTVYSRWREIPAGALAVVLMVLAFRFGHPRISFRG